MAYIQFSSFDLYTQTALGWQNGLVKGLSVPIGKIFRVSDNGTFTSNGDKLLTIDISNNDFSIEQLYVIETAAGITTIKNNPLFYTIKKENIFTNISGVWRNILSSQVIINLGKVINVETLTGEFAGNRPLSKITFEESFGSLDIYVPVGIASSISNQPTTVDFHPSTEFVYVNPLSDCYDVQIVNHDTGETNIFHTPHPANDWTLYSSYNVTPYGGFLAVFTNYSSTFLYFFDNKGNLVDQIDGFGPGYDWGNLSYRLVWGADYDNDGSVLKIFDGKNVRTHEFSGLCYFNMSPWSEGECSKNLYVPFEVYSFDEDKTYLYMSTPGGGLIDLDGDSWYTNESFTTIHPSSDKIFKLSWDSINEEYSKLEMYSEDGVLLNTLNLSGQNFNDYNTREYYGSNGNFYMPLYNYDDNTVPYLFVSANANVNTFATFSTPNNGTLYFNDYYRDYDIYDTYNSKGANSLVIITGENGMTPAPISGVNVFQSGAVVHWTSPTTGEWFSYTLTGGIGDEILISSNEGGYGTYPMFITFTGTAVSEPLEALILLHDGTVEVINTDVNLEEATSLSTFAMGDLTVTNINLSSNDVEWRVYSNSELVSHLTTDSFNWSIEGSTLALVDNNDINNSWAYNPTVGFISTEGGFPLPDSYFSLQSSQFGASYPIFGYNNTGGQVLIDRNSSDNVVGFYFLSENSNGWVHVINTLNDTGGWQAAELGNNHFLYVCENSGTGNFYAMTYNTTTGALVSGVKLDTADGSISYDQVGDRMSVKQETAPGVFNQYYFTKKGVIENQFDENFGVVWYAFNDAEWSND